MPLRILELDSEKRSKITESLKGRGLVVTERLPDNVDVQDWSDVPMIEVTAGKQVPEDQVISVVSEVLSDASLLGRRSV